MTYNTAKCIYGVTVDCICTVYNNT